MPVCFRVNLSQMPCFIFNSRMKIRDPFKYSCYEIFIFILLMQIIRFGLAETNSLKKIEMNFISFLGML